MGEKQGYSDENLKIHGGNLYPNMDMTTRSKVADTKGNTATAPTKGG